MIYPEHTFTSRSAFLPLIYRTQAFIRQDAGTEPLALITYCLFDRGDRAHEKVRVPFLYRL